MGRPTALPSSAPADWRLIVERMRSAQPALASVFEHAMPIEVGPQRVLLGFEAESGFPALPAHQAQVLAAFTPAVRGFYWAPTARPCYPSAAPARATRTLSAL